MAMLDKFQTSFEFGEVSPRLLARIDLNAYAKSLKTQENAYTYVQGGATKRRGTLLVGTVKDETQAARLIPFYFSDALRFMIVLNGGSLQILHNGSFVETSPGVRYSLNVPYTADQIKDIRFAQSGNTMYLVHPQHRPKLLQRVTNTNWILTDIPFTYNAVSDVTFSNAFITFKLINGAKVFQVGDTFTITTSSGAISSISALQRADQPKTSVMIASVGANISLTGLQTIDGRLLVANDRVLLKDQTNPAENGVWRASGTAWSRFPDMAAPSDFTNAHVRVMGGTVNANTYWKQTATVTAVGTSPQTWESSSELSNGTIAGVASMPGSTTSETWTITCVSSTAQRQEWSVVGSVSGAAAAYWKTGNWPQTVTFFEQRLFFGGSPQFPQHVWGSVAGDYLNFTVGNKDSDGVAVQIAGNDYNAIQHLVAARQLMILTSSTEFSMAGPSNFAISGISSNVIKAHTRSGSNNVRPLNIGKETIFLQRDGKKVRAISYSVTEDANIAPDITLFAEHLTRNTTLTDMAFASNPDFLAWAIRSDGTLLSLTLEREVETTAWARHTTDGKYEAVAAIPSVESDDVYLVVSRTVNGVTRRFVEMFDYEAVDTTYSDCAAYYNGAAITNVTGLSHLEGKTVSIVTDGVVHPPRVVASGSITLASPAKVITVGLPFSTTLELLNPEFGDSSSTSQGKKVSVTDIVVRFQDTINALINDVPIPFRKVGNAMDTPVEPFTGDKSVKNLGWNNTKNIILTSATPTPFIVLGVIIRAAIN